jgi:hypothetical protein
MQRPLLENKAKKLPGSGRAGVEAQILRNIITFFREYNHYYARGSWIGLPYKPHAPLVVSVRKAIINEILP